MAMLRAITQSISLNEPGVFSSITANNLTAGRVVLVGAAKQLTDDAGLTFVVGTGTLTATVLAGGTATITNSVTVGGTAVANPAVIINGTDASNKFFARAQSAGVTKLQAYVEATSHDVVFDTAALGAALKIIQAGTVLMASLAGTGSRAVLADANGLLSAPVSDETWKENIEALPFGLTTIMRLRPLRFNYRDRNKFGNQKYLGFGARATAKVLPEITGQDRNGTYYLTDEKLTAVLVRAVQQLAIGCGVLALAVLYLLAR